MEFDDALRALRIVSNATGLAIEFGASDLCGIDLDGCRDPETGVVSDWARLIVKQFQSYSEVSPSGTGIKIFFWDKRAGEMDQPWTQMSVKEPAVCDKAPGIEAYIGGTRFFCVTGERLRGLGEMRYASEAVDWLFDMYQKRPVTPPAEPLEAPRYSKAANYSLQLSRCRKVVDVIPGAPKGQRDAGLWRVAQVCHGFSVDPHDMDQILREWNERCDPPQSDINQRIRHKIEQLASSKLEKGRFIQEEVDYEYIDEVLEKEDVPFTYVRQGEMYAGLRERLKNGHYDLQTTGLYALDDVLGGGMPMYGVVAVMGRPSHGKTSLMQHCLREIGRGGRKCLFISKEMTIEELISREISGVEDSPRSEWKHLADAIVDKLEDKQVNDNITYVDDCRDLTDIEKCIRYSVEHDGTRVIAVDYLQRIPVRGADSEYARVSASSMRLANLAKELKVLIFLAVQMNRAREAGGKVRASVMSDARGSGQIEQDMDLMIHVEWPHIDDDERPENEYQISVLKSRFIRPTLKTFLIDWDCTTQTFEPPVQLSDTTEWRPDRDYTEVVQEAEKGLQGRFDL
jgi:archaellum biogenesis ATPase FlaH